MCLGTLGIPLHFSFLLSYDDIQLYFCNDHFVPFLFFSFNYLFIVWESGGGWGAAGDWYFGIIWEGGLVLGFLGVSYDEKELS